MSPGSIPPAAAHLWRTARRPTAPPLPLHLPLHLFTAFTAHRRSRWPGRPVVRRPDRSPEPCDDTPARRCRAPMTIRTALSAGVHRPVHRGGGADSRSTRRHPRKIMRRSGAPPLGITAQDTIKGTAARPSARLALAGLVLAGPASSGRTSTEPAAVHRAPGACAAAPANGLWPHRVLFSRSSPAVSGLLSGHTADPIRPGTTLRDQRDTERHQVGRGRMTSQARTDAPQDPQGRNGSVTRRTRKTPQHSGHGNARYT